MKKINIIDILMFSIVITICAVIGFSFSENEETKEENAILKVTVSKNIEILKEEVEESIGEKMYMNGIKDPIVLESFEVIEDSLFLTFSDMGYEENNTYIFNGQRILIGQKIELHGRFWAQGIISSFSYESN